MNAVDITPDEILDAEPDAYSEKGGVFWYGDAGLNVRDVARAMNSVGDMRTQE